MSNAAWIPPAITEFGTHFGFQNFALNEHGVAAATFENGFAVHLEYARDLLCLQIRVPITPDLPTLKKLLVAAHPDNHFSFLLRTAFLPKTSQALFLVQFPERDVTATALWQVFEELWSIATAFGGAQ